jgi:hypothetical protein
MPRYVKTVGMVRCRTDAATMNEIAASGGLSAEPAGEPNLFYLRNSGREIEAEIASDLFAAVSARLDQAVRGGVIPPWSLVRR